jgi:hypothetical protein
MSPVASFTIRCSVFPFVSRVEPMTRPRSNPPTVLPTVPTVFCSVLPSWEMICGLLSTNVSVWSTMYTTSSRSTSSNAAARTSWMVRSTVPISTSAPALTFTRFATCAFRLSFAVTLSTFRKIRSTQTFGMSSTTSYSAYCRDRGVPPVICREVSPGIRAATRSESPTPRRTARPLSGPTQATCMSRVPCIRCVPGAAGRT